MAEEIREQLNDSSDEALLAAAQEGSEDAAELLICRYRDLVKSKASRYFPVGQDREDLVQEGLLGLLKAILSFNSEKGVSFRAFASLCIDRRIATAAKAAIRQKHSPLNMSLSLDWPEGDDAGSLRDSLASDARMEPEVQLIWKETLNNLQEGAPSILSPLEQKVWQAYLSGRSYEQIAAELGKDMKAVDNAIQRCKKKMRRYLLI